MQPFNINTNWFKPETTCTKTIYLRVNVAV